MKLLLTVALAVLSVHDHYQWELPPGFPAPHVPADNPMSKAKVRLGRYLFYDQRMSVNATMSCASCHRQELAFTDGRAVAAGATGQTIPRSSMSLVNVAYSEVLTWNRPHVGSLEQQLLIPLLSTEPVELGMGGRTPEFLRVLRSDSTYRPLFPQAFPGGRDPFTQGNVAKAIAAFERTIISARSPYDRYRYGHQPDAISDAAKRGEVLYFSDPVAACYRCHGGFNLGDGRELHNNGLGESGKFKAPTLRNIALTAPYMHDGRIPTLAGVIDHYASGGHKTPDQDPRVRELPLTPQNRRDLVAFLESLTDEELITDPRFANPW